MQLNLKSFVGDGISFFSEQNENGNLIRVIVFFIVFFIGLTLYYELRDGVLKNNAFLSISLILINIAIAFFVSQAASEKFKSLSLSKGNNPKYKIMDYFTKQRFIILCLLILSWFATSSGLLAIVKEQSGDEVFSDSQFIVQFYVFVLTITMAQLNVGWLSPGSSIPKFFVAFVGWLILVVFSVSFSFAYFWTLLESTSQLNKQIEEKVSLAENNLITIQNTIGGLESLVDTMAQASLYKSLKEKGLKRMEDGTDKKIPGWGGNTCGALTEIRDGPRSRLRERVYESLETNKKYFSNKKSDMAITAKNLEDSLSRIKSIDKSSSQLSKEIFWEKEISTLNKVLNVFVNKYNSVAGSVEVLSMKSWLNENARNFSTSDKNFTEGSKRFSCYDSELSGQFKTVANTLENLPKIEEVSIENYFGSKATKEALTRFYQALFGFLGLAVNVNDVSIDVAENKETTETLRSLVNNLGVNNQEIINNPVDESHGDTLPLIIAIAIDFILFAMMFRDAKPRRLSRYEETVNGASSNNPLDDLGRLRKSLDKSPEFEMFSNYLVHLHGDDYIAIPKNSKKSHQVMRGYMTMLKDSNVVKQELSMESVWSKKIIESMESQNPTLYESHVHGYYIYKLSEGTLADFIMRLIRKQKNQEKIIIHARRERNKSSANQQTQTAKKTPASKKPVKKKVANKRAAAKSTAKEKSANDGLSETQKAMSDHLDELEKTQDALTGKT